MFIPHTHSLVCIHVYAHGEASNVNDASLNEPCTLACRPSRGTGLNLDFLAT